MDVVLDDAIFTSMALTSEIPYSQAKVVNIMAPLSQVVSK